MRQVYIEGRSQGWELHSLYDSLVRYPPNGYNFITDSNIDDTGVKFRSLDKFLVKRVTMQKIMDYLKSPAYLTYYKYNNREKKIESDFTYSSQHVVFRNEPWVVDLEYVNSLVAYGKLKFVKKIIEKKLGSKNCKWILPWTDMAHKTLLLNLNCKQFSDKIKTIHLAVPSKFFKKEKINDKIRILFIGTKNIFNIPYSFELKGGPIILEAFNQLQKKYDNIELILRSQVPSYIYTKTKSNKNVKIYDKLLSKKNIEKLFVSSDIFVFPGHQTPGLALLDAMSYGLPIVATDVWANREMVHNGENGYLVKKSRFLNYYGKDLVPLWGEGDFLKKVWIIDRDMVNDLVDKLSLLIVNDKIRENFGWKGKKMIDEGKFQLNNRNKILKKLFDEINV